MNSPQKYLLLFIAATTLGGCSTTKEMYYWGSYETLIYQMYKNPGTQPPTEQIYKLTADIQKAKNSGKNIAPGLYAHLGYMYSLAGAAEESKLAFNEEKRLFPESAKMIDGMFERATNAAFSKGGKK